MELKGSKTEKNLMEAFAGESQKHLQENHKQETNIRILQVRQEKMAMNKLQQYLKKQLQMKKSMQNYGLNY